MKRDQILIEADELSRILDHENIRIYDATISDGQYLQKHIPGAAFFDHVKFSDPNNPYDYMVLPEAELAAQIGKIGISAASEVIFYVCGMLPYAARAWWMLRYAGHNNVRVLNGGLSAWEKAGGGIEREPRNYEPSFFKGQLRPNMFASKEDVMQALQDADVSTVNVMPLESFEASHITGSTCLPCLDLMHAMDSFLPDDKLAERLAEMSQRKRIITYCGAGIAAAVNAMAHLMVGQENVAVYDGSLYEWLGEGLPTTGSGKWEVWKK
jgi:thiosulfate/3-mercaptopyruvate sulfurtransferase